MNTEFQNPDDLFAKNLDYNTDDDVYNDIYEIKNTLAKDIHHAQYYWRHTDFENNEAGPKQIHLLMTLQQAQIMAETDGAERKSMFGFNSLLKIFTISQNSHVPTADVRNDLDRAVIEKWQAIYKGTCQKKYRDGAYTADKQYELVDNTTCEQFVQILAFGIEEIDNTIDNAIDNAEKAADKPQICFAYAHPKVLADQIHADFPLNNLQQLVVERVLDHMIQAQTRLCVSRENQLFLYVRGEKGVGKSQVIKALQLRFLLLKQSHKLAILASTEVAANNIDGSTIHTALSINKDGKKVTKFEVPSRNNLHLSLIRSACWI